MMIEATDFRNAMSLLTSAVNVVTTSGASGRHGFTASAISAQVRVLLSLRHA